MPIGVPKVPFRLPGEPDAQWVDLYNRLYRERVLFLCQDLNDELANQLIGIMLYLNAEESSKDLYIYINSPGGSVTCGIAVYDILNYIQVEVITLCVGTAASMASFILTGGSRGKRIAFPHSRIMIHQPEGGSQGQASEIVSESEEVVRIRRQVGKIYSSRTGQSLARISKDMDRDQFMSAREAKEYGLVDHLPSTAPSFLN
jgi:ATP-dependent Clp protease protease subunit|uniref:ATP-dependent Clp protease proteolytic subunit n=2 Tax=unclassified Ostreobium TaxID=2086555 RepID=A0A1X9RQ74_9CHLO|nr:Clp protease proteolytic subunit [Ostreobium sp. HV05042]ARQ82323.1 Clp protease proteolytic subunit [Ostreobium sp. HV05007a]